MTTPSAGDLICPQCGHSNPPRSDYCWECRFDFVPDDRPKASARPPAAPRPIPPLYSPTPSEPKPARQEGALVAFVIELVVSSIIVGGSWLVLSFAYPSMNLLAFLAGWAVALMVVIFSEGRLPEVEADSSKYWSLNPFEFQDDRNRRVLSWHMTLFLPRIVLRTIRNGFAVFSNAR